MDALTQLKQMTTVVADTGDLAAIRDHRPVDATTNPSLLLKAAQMPAYADTVQAAKDAALAAGGSSAEQLMDCTERLAVAVGVEILGLVPGRVSTEVAACHSFDPQAIVAAARRLLGHYNAAGISNDRVLVKTAATWAGIRAAEQLEREGIQCNLTLLFGFGQAQACADAGVFLISPFVGRITDWFKASTGTTDYAADEDPGVLSVRRIHSYYKGHGYNTVVMGASFRSTAQVKALAGCDRLTISPALLAELAADQAPLVRQLDPAAPGDPDPRASLSEAAFAWTLNEDRMATEQLSDGIRRFHADEQTLHRFLQDGQ